MSELVLVCGSRDWTDEEPIRLGLTVVKGTHPDALIMHGGARGADRLAGKIAKELGFAVLSVPADWRQFGRSAGYRRNVQMLELGPAFVLAFQRENSRGTAHVIAEAEKRGIKVLLYRQREEEAA